MLRTHVLSHIVMAVVLGVLIVTQVVSAHAIEMDIYSVKLENNTLIVKGKVYFPGFGPARDASVYAYKPNCTSFVCPPTCKVIAKTKTDNAGYFVLRIPVKGLVRGEIEIAGVPGPEHAVCDVLTVVRSGSKIRYSVKEHTLFEPIFNDETFGEYAVYYGFAFGFTILIGVAAGTWVLTRRKGKR